MRANGVAAMVAAILVVLFSSANAAATTPSFLRFRGGVTAAMPKAVEKQIIQDDALKLMEALRQGVLSAEDLCKNSDTAMHLACRYGASNCLQALLSEPSFEMDVLRETDGVTPLMTASQGGHAACVRLLLGAGAKVNLQELTAGTPALHYAVRWGHLQCLEALLAAPGVDVNLARHKDGVSALHVAAFNGQDACVTALLKARANAAQRSMEHLSALDYACREGLAGTVALLLKSNAAKEVGPVELGGTAPIHWAATGGAKGLAEAGHVGCLQALLAAGGHPDLLRTRDGSSALHYAAIGNMRFSNEECVRVLLEGAGVTKLAQWVVCSQRSRFLTISCSQYFAQNRCYPTPWLTVRLGRWRRPKPTTGLG